MNILMLTSDYLPDPLWGMAWHVKQLRDALTDAGHDVYVGTAYKSRNYDPNTITTSKSIDLKLLSSERYEIFNDFHKFNMWQEALADAVISENLSLDVIHCHNWMSWITAKKLKSYYPEVKVVATFHFLQKQYESMEENPVPTFHQEVIDIEQDAMSSVDNIIALSSRQQDFIVEKYGIGDRKIRIIPHSTNFDPPTIEQLMAAKARGKLLRFVFVGRLELHKGIRETLEVFQSLCKNYENLHLDIVGDGPLLQKMQALYDTSNITFHGFLKRDKLESILTQAHIFCMPSSGEVLPLTVLEAMFYAVVPVFTYGENLPEMYIDGQHGLLVPLIDQDGYKSPDTQKMYEALDRLISDSSLRENLSIATRRHADANYSIEAMVKKLNNVYIKLEYKNTSCSEK